MLTGLELTIYQGVVPEGATADQAPRPQRSALRGYIRSSPWLAVPGVYEDLPARWQAEALKWNWWLFPEAQVALWGKVLRERPDEA